jgi:hypothetical protein
MIDAFQVPVTRVPTAVMPVYPPLSLPDGSVPEVMLVAFVVSVVADAAKPETCPAAMAMVVFVALVIWPCALTAMTGTVAAAP